MILLLLETTCCAARETGEVKITDVLALTGVSKPTLYRWMEKHPTIDNPVEAPDQTTLVGHPFPKPVSSERGKPAEWDEEHVKAWWADNASTVGRHPAQELTSITIPWDRFIAAMETKPDVKIVGDEEMLDDHRQSFVRVERDGKDAHISFRDVQDAVLFRLRFS